MPKPMTFSTKKFVFPPKEPAVPTRPVPLQERSSRHLDTLHWCSFLDTSVLICVGETSACSGCSKRIGQRRFFSPNSRAFRFSSRKGTANEGIIPIKREEKTGFELQKKPAHYSKGSCKVQGHTVKEKEKKKKKEKAFKPSPASIKAITLLHGTFIVPLQLRQQLFTGAGLKTRPEPVLCCSSTSSQAFPTPSSMHRHAQPVAATPKFISPFNWISWRRARRGGEGPGLQGCLVGQAGCRGGDRVAVAGSCLLHPPHTEQARSSTGWESSKALFLVSIFSERRSLPFRRAQKRLGLTRSHFLTVSEAKASPA